MPPKKFALNQTHGYIGETRSKSKPRVIIEADWITEYRLHRDICWYIQHGGECEWSEEQVEEVRRIYFGGQQELF